MGMKRRVLAGLDDTAWERLEHAYGSAKDVPGWLRGLTSTSADDRDRAFAQLSNSVCHQGWASSSAAEVAPFLIELACEPSVPDRGRIVALVADLSVGGMHTAHLQSGYVHQPTGEPELAWLDRLRASVSDARGRLAALYTDKDSAVRAAVSVAMAMLGEHAEELAPAVRAALQKERKGTARASAVIALGMLGHVLGTSEDVPRFQAALDDRSKYVRTAAAIALSYVESPARRDAIEELARSARDGDRAVKGLFWGDGDLANLASRVLVLRGGVPALVDYLKSAPRPKRHDAAGTIALANTARQILRLAFPQPLPQGSRADDLNDDQRHAVTLLSSYHLFWDERITPKLGLPKQPEDARQWLGIPEPPPPATPLDDETITWGESERSVRAAWIDASSADTEDRAGFIRAIHECFDATTAFQIWLDAQTIMDRWLLGPHMVELASELLVSLKDTPLQRIDALLAEAEEWGGPFKRIKNRNGTWFTTTHKWLNGWYAVAFALSAARRGEQPDQRTYEHLMSEISSLKPIPAVYDAIRAFDEQRRIELVLRPHRGPFWWLAPSKKVSDWAHYYLSRIPTRDSLKTALPHFDQYVAALHDAGRDDEATALTAAVAARLDD